MVSTRSQWLFIQQSKHTHPLFCHSNYRWRTGRIERCQLRLMEPWSRPGHAHIWGRAYAGLFHARTGRGRRGMSEAIRLSLDECDHGSQSTDSVDKATDFIDEPPLVISFLDWWCL